jgi:hypothetical protein
MGTEALLPVNVSDCEAYVYSEHSQKETQAANDILPKLVSDVDRRVGKTLTHGRNHKEDAEH